MNQEQQAPARISPTTIHIVQAMVCGFIGAAFVSLFLWLEHLISGPPKPVPVADPLHGASSPAEMNMAVDALLVLSSKAMDHDVSLVRTLGILVAVLSTLSILSGGAYVLRMRREKQDVPPTWRTVIVILALALPPVLATCILSIREDSLLQTSPILQSMGNENTKPHVVCPGEEAVLTFPLGIPSNSGYYEQPVLNMDSSVAQLVDGQTIAVTFPPPTIMDSGGSRPSKRCNRKLNAFKLQAGHLCRDCLEADKKQKTP
ncbi:MAG: hypothetical protein ACOC95_04810 [Planctomycetota bacterium]